MRSLARSPHSQCHTFCYLLIFRAIESNEIVCVRGSQKSFWKFRNRKLVVNWRNSKLSFVWEISIGEKENQTERSRIGIGIKMPVISSRRYSSSSYLTPSTTTSSSVGSYRSNYSSLSSTTNSSSSKDLPTSTSRYNFGDSSYRSSYRPSLTSGISSSGTTGSYRSRYDYDDKDKSKTTSTSSSSSLSTRIGVSKTSSSSNRYNSDTLPPLPPTASSSSSSVTNAHTYAHSKRSLSRSRDQKDSGDSNGVGSSSVKSDRSNGSRMSLMSDLDFYEKYSPSRYMTKYELSRSRSLSEAAPTPTRDKSPSSSKSLNNDTPTHTPKCEVCQKSHQHYLSFLTHSLTQRLSLSCVVFTCFMLCTNFILTHSLIHLTISFFFSFPTPINKSFFVARPQLDPNFFFCRWSTCAVLLSLLAVSVFFTLITTSDILWHDHKHIFRSSSLT